MTGWHDLESELDAWAAAGQPARLWWRDDDAEAPGEGLETLLALRREVAVPLAVAVIPASARTALGDRLAGEADVAVLQHGYDHRNYAPPGAKKAELAEGRSRVKVVAQLAEGRERLVRLFGDRFEAILVPPWNRIDAALPALLPRAGYRGLSAFAGRHRPPPVSGLGRADCHIDVVDWHGGRGFVGEDAALDQAVRHLAAARRAPEAVGLLTHHRVLDAAGWAFVGEFLDRVRRHGGADWIGAADALFFAP